jgi:arginine decarboxylase
MASGQPDNIRTISPDLVKPDSRDNLGAVSKAQAYNSWWQFRSDVWSRLGEMSDRLAAAASRGQSTTEMTVAIHELFGVVEAIEQCWAFPGLAAYLRARELFRAARYDRLARMVARINRALVTESYRAGNGWWAMSGDHEDCGGEGPMAEPVAEDRPYFEVLVCRPA